MSSGLHPHIMFDLASSAMAERRRSDRARDQRAAGAAGSTRASRRVDPGPTQG